MVKNSLKDTASQDLGTLFGVGAVGGLSDGQLLGRFVGAAGGGRLRGDRPSPRSDGLGRLPPGAPGPPRRRGCLPGDLPGPGPQGGFDRPREKLGNWLYGVAYQTAMKARAKRVKRRGREGQVSDMPEPTVRHENCGMTWPSHSTGS